MVEIKRIRAINPTGGNSHRCSQYKMSVGKKKNKILVTLLSQDDPLPRERGRRKKQMVWRTTVGESLFEVNRVLYYRSKSYHKHQR